jgi:glucokinase
VSKKKSTAKKKSAPAKFYVGLDIGGSTVKSAVVDNKGKQVGRMYEVPSLVDQGFKKTFSQMTESFDLLLADNGIKKSQVGGIGMDVPAPSCDGVIWGQANLNSDWVGVNVRDAFAKDIKKKVFMTNDGSAAAYGEYALRRRKIKGMLFCAPGTGLAGGLILENGDIFEGCNGLALEIGHVSSPFRENGKLPKCSCGKKGCVEANVSLVALRRQLAAKLKQPKYKNHSLNKERLNIKAKAFKLRDLADAGDKMALEIFDHQGFVLGYALGDQAHELNPEVIVIGGGLSESSFRETFMKSIKRGFAERALPSYQKSPLKPHKPTIAFEWAIGGDAGAALGVALKARDVYS